MSDSPVPRRYLLGIRSIEPEDDDERHPEDIETRRRDDGEPAPDAGE